MKYGDEYLHFKGNRYRFIGIALPMTDAMSEETINSMTYVGEARYHDNTRDVSLYVIDGAHFIKSDVPHVIYQSEKDYETDRVWAREVDDFFGYKLTPEGNFVKRFALAQID